MWLRRLAGQGWAVSRPAMPSPRSADGSLRLHGAGNPAGHTGDRGGRRAPLAASSGSRPKADVSRSPFLLVPLFFSLFEKNARRGCTFEDALAHGQPPPRLGDTLAPREAAGRGSVCDTPKCGRAAPLRTAEATTPAVPSVSGLTGAGRCSEDRPQTSPRPPQGVAATAPVARHSRTSAWRRGQPWGHAARSEGRGAGGTHLPVGSLSQNLQELELGGVRLLEPVLHMVADVDLLDHAFLLGESSDSGRREHADRQARVAPRGPEASLQGLQGHARRGRGTRIPVCVLVCPDVLAAAETQNAPRHLGADGRRGRGLLPARPGAGFLPQQEKAPRPVT